MSGFSRRGLLAGLGSSIGALPLAGCSRPSLPERAYSRKPWAAPRIAPANVIREVVGHRPFRPGGFEVRAEETGPQLLVHNYGHGGGGISLAWGSSALAVRELGDRAAGECFFCRIPCVED